MLKPFGFKGAGIFSRDHFTPGAAVSVTTLGALRRRAA
jgi:hypothetical protein